MHPTTMTRWAVLAALAFTGDVTSAQEVGAKASPDAAKTALAEKAMAGFKHPEGTTVKVFAAEPLLAGPVAFDVDYDGRVYVAETDRFDHGAPDNRQHMYWLLDDLAADTLADREAYYEKWIVAGKKKREWFTERYDQVRRITDADGDGRADESHVLARFNGPLDGIGSGILADRGDLYYSNIPHLWKLRDADNDGKAEVREKLSTGYGVRTALLGHDLHGLTWGPDGKLYFSIGDRGFNITTPDRRTLKHTMDIGRGAVFRCKPDGSELEVYAWGLRNPQELAFDDYGNLWTGDNNSDAGDKARLVYVVEQGDSGWAMSFQTLEGDYRRGPWNQEKLWHLRHAAVVALSRIGDADAVLKFADDESRAVRLGVLLTLRRMQDARIARFLKDADHSLVIEAARAIHDLPIAGAIDALADMLGGGLGPPDNNHQTTFALHRRVYNAAFRRGTVKDAARLAAYTADAKNPHLMRRETMKALREFANPGVRDFVLGFHRPLPKRDPGIVTAAIQPHMKAMLGGDLKGEATALAVQYRVPLDRKAMIAQVADEASPATFRIAALRALASASSDESRVQRDQTIDTALRSKAPMLRAAALDQLAALDSKRATPFVRRALDRGDVAEQQRAIALLANVDRDRLGTMVMALAADKLAPELRLDVYRAAIAHDPAAWGSIAQLTPKIAVGDLATLTSLTSDGGDPAVGKTLFLGHAAAQCQRCHKVDGVGGDAGPDLSAIGKRRDRTYLVRALVAPQAEVAEGYGTISVTLYNGKTHAGIVRDDTDGKLTLLTPDGKPITVAASGIASRTPPISAMPPMGFILKPHELRDVVAYLATLKTESKDGAADGE